MHKDIGIGVIGCGTIAEFMLNAWLPNARNARLVAASDPNPARTDLFRRKYGIEREWADHRDLLDSGDVDAVLVLTPNHLHAPQTLDALEAGKDVMCQKPMALTVAEAEAMNARAADSGRILMAGFVKRFWPYFQILDDLRKQEVLGEVRNVRSQFSHSGIGRYYKPASQWFSDRSKAGGGPLFDLGVHHFDAMRWLVGSEITEVNCLTSGGTEAAGQMEDNAVVGLRFAQGAIGQGNYSFTTQTPPGVTLECLELYGTKATAMVALEHPGRPVVRISVDGDLLSRGGWIDLPVTETVPPFSAMVQHFVDCIAEGAQPVTDGSDGLKSVAVAEAAYESQASGRTVRCRIAEDAAQEGAFA